LRLPYRTDRYDAEPEEFWVLEDTAVGQAGSEMAICGSVFDI